MTDQLFSTSAEEVRGVQTEIQDVQRGDSVKPPIISTAPESLLKHVTGEIGSEYLGRSVHPAETAVLDQPTEPFASATILMRELASRHFAIDVAHASKIAMVLNSAPPTPLWFFLKRIDGKIEAHRAKKHHTKRNSC